MNKNIYQKIIIAFIIISFAIGGANYSMAENNSATLYELEGNPEKLFIDFVEEISNSTNDVEINIKNTAQIGAKIPFPARANTNPQTYPETYRPQTTVGTNKIAAILFNFQDNATEPFTKEEVRKEIYDNTNHYYKEISFNKLSISGYNSLDGAKDMYGWHTIPINASSGCDPDAWADMAEELAATKDGFNKNNYSNIIYFFPRISNCPFGMRADIGFLGNYNNIYESWFNGFLIPRYYIALALGYNL